MVLTVKERLLLGGILPKQGDFSTLKIVTKLQLDLSFSEEEHKVLQFVSKDGMINWNVEEDKKAPKDIPIGEKATDVVVETLKKLSTEKKLTLEYMSLYEKFVKE